MKRNICCNYLCLMINVLWTVFELVRFFFFVNLSFETYLNENLVGLDSMAPSRTFSQVATSRHPKLYDMQYNLHFSSF